MLAIGIAPAPATPGIFQRPCDLQRFLGFLIIRLELVEADRPVAAVAERRLAFEPFGTPAKGDHRVVNRAAAHATAGIVGAELDRIGPARDPFVGPEEAALVTLVRGEVVQGPPKRASIEGYDREAGLRELAGERTAARARSDDCEIDLVVIVVAAHRRPFAGPEDIRRTTVSRSGLCDLKHR